MREKKIFCIYGCVNVSRYIKAWRSKEVENHISKHNWIFKHLHMHKQPTLKKQWNYNFFVNTLYSYFRHTGRLSLDCALFGACCNIIRAPCETKKERLSYRKEVNRRICERDITSLTARPPFYVVFCCFLRLVPPLSQVTYLLNGSYEDT